MQRQKELRQLISAVNSLKVWQTLPVEFLQKLSAGLEELMLGLKQTTAPASVYSLHLFTNK